MKIKPHFTKVILGKAPGHVGLNNVAHLAYIALIVSGKKYVVQVFVHISLAHCHPENTINISCVAQIWSGYKGPSCTPVSLPSTSTPHP